VAQLEGIDDREAAGELVRHEIAVPRSELPPAEPGEFYWVDLIGLEVETLEGVVLGRVVDLVETGANDVLVVQGDRERLLPFVQGQCVRSIDLDSGRMTVDWDPDF
jgi:16S rRNA processing protein RimM